MKAKDLAVVHQKSCRVVVAIVVIASSQVF